MDQHNFKGKNIPHINLNPEMTIEDLKVIIMGILKAKDWVGLEASSIFCRVQIPKVHGVSFPHSRGPTRNDALFCYIIVADRLWTLA